MLEVIPPEKQARLFTVGKDAAGAVEKGDGPSAFVARGNLFELDEFVSVMGRGK